VLHRDAPFQRRRGPTLRHRLWQFRRRYPLLRIASKPWVIVVGLFGAAIAGWSLSDLRADSVVGWLSEPGRVVASARDIVLRPSGAGDGPKILRPQRVGGSGDFQLCLGWRLENCVIDGDTIRFGGVKIRLADIDTPEVFSPKCGSEAALGQQATERLLELINAGPFELAPAGSRDEDRYGRKLRTIERNGRSLGDTLVAEGLACRWDGARRGWCG
jgi:micrococcal nuclease